MEQIITDTEKLTSPAEPLKFMDETGTHADEGKEIIAKLKEVMENDKDILALSAPQIGINKRIFCIRFSDQIKAFINPILKKKGQPIISYETCASFPNKEIAICRPKDIEVSYYNEDFKYEDNKFLNAAAKIFDQQVQILDGILPGQLIKHLEMDKPITVNEIPALIAAEYSGCGLVVSLNSEEDHLTTENLEEVATILGSYCDQFRHIGQIIKNSTDESQADIRYIYKNMLLQDQVITGKIELISDSPKLNREQRRAIEKRAKKLKTKKAGK